MSRACGRDARGTLELRGEREADVGAVGEGGDDERDRCGDTLLPVTVVPDGAHAHGVFADRNRNAEGGAQLHAYGLNGGVEVRGVAGDGGRSHPVGGQIDLAEVADLGGREVGERFADGEAGRGGGVVHSDGRAFAHGHRLTGVYVESSGGDGAVGYGDLPWADHLITADETAERTVADGDQERLVRHGRVREHTADGVRCGHWRSDSCHWRTPER